MATDVRKLVQDTAYVAVGVGVLAVQRAQVARREARSRLDSQLKETRDRLTSTAADARSAVADVRSRVEPVRDRLRTTIEPIADQVQERLPDTLAKLVERGRTVLHASSGSAA